MSEIYKAVEQEGRCRWLIISEISTQRLDRVCTPGFRVNDYRESNHFVHYPRREFIFVTRHSGRTSFDVDWSQYTNDK